MKPKNEALITELNRILQLEYSLIIHYPQISRMIRNEEARKLTASLGDASLSHANAVSNAISKLGGTPSWSFEPLPDDDNLIRVFQKQLEKERLARDLHTHTAALATDATIKSDLYRLATEEESHITIVEKIISLLK